MLATGNAPRLKLTLEDHCANLVANHVLLSIKLTTAGLTDALSASTRPLTAPAAAAAAVVVAAVSEEVTVAAAVVATVAVVSLHPLHWVSS
jgi:hypothetical protein